MNCNQIQPNLLDYNRGLLNQREAAAVRAHLNVCPECRAVMDAEIKLADRLSAAPAIEPQSDVWTRVEAKISTHRHKRSVFDLFFAGTARKLATAVTALTVLIAVMIAMYEPPAPPSQKESINQAIVMMQVQPVEPAASVGDTTDEMMKVLENAL
ncbi:MAG TPA: zf-HC2 domain-containing protein [Armatimonadota bacterium]|jgi:anti-sigma factor RsiW|nr:zf-HC2 domain-containing protein [Armatimonadota bacterium]